MAPNNYRMGNLPSPTVDHRSQPLPVTEGRSPRAARQCKNSLLSVDVLKGCSSASPVRASCGNDRKLRSSGMAAYHGYLDSPFLHGLHLPQPLVIFHLCHTYPDGGRILFLPIESVMGRGP